MEMNELKSCEKNSLGFNFVSFFLIKLFIEIIVDLHTVLRNNTERFLVSSTQCPPKVVSSKIIVQHHNLDLDIEYNPLIFRITQFYSTHMCVCVCVWFYPSLSHVQLSVSIAPVKIQNIFVTTKLP